MMKIIGIFSVLILVTSIAFAGGNKDSYPKPTAQPEVQPMPNPVPTSPQPSNPFFTGEGGKGKSIAILAPKGSGLAKELDYIPSLVQGEFVSNFSGYSAISVLDRQRLDEQYAELLSGYYDDNVQTGMDLGKLTPTDYIMGGNITRTATGYNLQISITKTADKMTEASYSATFAFAELDNLSSVRRASIDLLHKMGVQLTERAKTELARAATSNQVDAQTALARGITAQRGGTEVAALSYYFQAAALDPSLQEAANRSSIISANIRSGNIGADVRNDIQWRKDWIARLTETEEFFHRIINSMDPPYTLFYSTGIQQGAINYQRETSKLSILLNLRANNTWFNSVMQATNAVYSGLNATGRKEAWGVGNWPQQGVVGTSPFASQRQYNFSIVFELVNQDNRVIGSQTINLNPAFGFSRHDDKIVGNYEENIYDIVTFSTVKVDDITDSLTIRIASVNKAVPQNARLPMRAVPDSMWQNYSHLDVENGVVRGFKQGIPREQYCNLIIWGGAITSIGNRAFEKNQLTSVIIGNGVISIGNSAFYDNNQLTRVTISDGVISIGERAFGSCTRLTSVTIGDSVVTIGERAFLHCSLTSVTIGNSVTSIGESAFSYNRLTNVTIPDSVTSIGEWAFYMNQLTSVIIGNGVTSIEMFAFSGNDRLFSVTIGANVNMTYGLPDGLTGSYADENARRAGTYTRYGGHWSYSK